MAPGVLLLQLLQLLQLSIPLSSHAVITRPDSPFHQIVSQRFLTTDGLHARNVSVRPPWPILAISGAQQVVSAPGGGAWILARGKVLHLDNNSTVSAVVGVEGAAQIVRVGASFAAVSSDAVQLMQCAGSVHCQPATPPVSIRVGNVTASTSVANATGTFVVACGTLGCNCVQLVGAKSVVVSMPAVVGIPTAVAASGAQLAVSTDHGLFITEGSNTWRNIPPVSFGGPITSLASVQVPPPSKDYLWIGTARCVNVLLPDWRIERLVGKDGLPMAGISVLTPLEDRGVWLGSGSNGAALWDGGDWRYFYGDRFLAGNKILSIAVDDAVVYLLSTEGIARIQWHMSTLSDKARQLQAMVSTPRHDRFHVVTPVALGRYADLSSWTGVQNDNDGLWTGMYIAAQAWRLAASIDISVADADAARAEAWRGYEGLEFLHNVTGIPGLMARSVIRCGTKHGAGDEPLTGWVNSSVCFPGYDQPDSPCCWTWKTDASSDEVTGHMTGLNQMYRHVAATPAEKLRVGKLLCKMMARIVDSNYVLLDFTGKRTKFGYWDPQELNGPNPSRGSNSLQMLGFLSSAHAICDSDGNLPHPKNGSFGDSFVYLVREHGYDFNAMFAHPNAPTCLFATYVDRLSWLSQLMIMENPQAQLGLLPDEQAAFRDRFATSILSYWNSTALSTQQMRLGLWDALVQLLLRSNSSGLSNNPDWMLQRWPLELIDWPVKNSHRLDVGVDPDFAQTCKSAHPLKWSKPSRALPPDESVMRDYASFATEGAWALDSSGGQAGPPGMREETPTTFLMEYWFKRFKGILSGPSSDAQQIVKTDDNARPRPQLSGIFLCAANAAKGYNQSRWHSEFRAMRKLNISFAVLRGVLYGNSRSWTAACPLGHYQALYQPGPTLQPAACFMRRGLRSPGGSLGAILQAAQDAGMNIHLGMVWPPAGIRDGPGDFDWNATDLPGKYPALAAIQLAAAKDIWWQFPTYRSTIVGVYAELEVGNVQHWTAPANAAALATSYLEPLAKAIKAELAPRLKVWLSPWYLQSGVPHPRISSALNASATAAFWSTLWQHAPSFDFVAPQDHVGKWNSLDIVSEYLSALGDAAAAADPPRELWSNVELSEAWPVSCRNNARPKGVNCSSRPASFSRIAAQMKAESASPRVQRLIAWEWLSGLSPFTSPATASNFAQYKEYIGTKTDDTVQTGKDTLPVLNWPVPREWLNVRTGCPTATTAAAGAAGAAGAIGDGAADDTAAIQACFDLVSNETQQHSVYLPAGNYKITSTLRLFKGLGILIIGEGEGTRLLWAGERGGRVLVSDGLSRSRFVGFVMDGQKSAAVGFEYRRLYAINLYNSHHI
jgi:hypothetical protein